MSRKSDHYSIRELYEKQGTRYQFAIIEDDYDHEFHYGHQPVLPLAAADTEGLVLYIGSLPKLVAPSIRMGYVAGTRQVIETLS